MSRPTSANSIVDELATEYMRVAQAYVDWMIRRQGKEPDKYAAIREQDVPTPLSDRWQRCAWGQASGIVRSWYANGRENPPVLRNICIQANTNVVVSEPSETPAFDFWLRISTLEDTVRHVHGGGFHGRQGRTAPGWGGQEMVS